MAFIPKLYVSANKGHKNAKWLRLIADGVQLQARQFDGSWKNESPVECMKMITNDFTTDGTITLRIATATVRVGEYNIPLPMSSAPPMGADYYFISPTSKDGICDYNWDGGSVDQAVFESGLCWLDKDDAYAALDMIKKLLLNDDYLPAY